jgi:hypothetical protein
MCEVSPGLPILPAIRPGIALILAATQRRSALSRGCASSYATIARSERRATPRRGAAHSPEKILEAPRPTRARAALNGVECDHQNSFT